MPRRLRLETTEGAFHVINRGNYRTDVFQSDRTKAAFLKCLGETCERTDWLVHAWCIMSNHYHVALSTPQGNLADGMRWWQGTFAVRFNARRDERGHLFQGRYKSLLVDPAGGLGSVCHYIHLNPTAAGLCEVEALPDFRWTSLYWLFHPRRRPEWYQPIPALQHAGGLVDSRAGRKKYCDYLAWLAEDEPARKQQKFDAMGQGWIIGTRAFAKATLQEYQELKGQGPRNALELPAAREAIWTDTLDQLLGQLHRTRAELQSAGKSVEWKLALAARLKARTTATNRWIAENLRMGNHHEVSRKVARWVRQPNPALLPLIDQTPSPKP